MRNGVIFLIITCIAYGCSKSGEQKAKPAWQIERDSLYALVDNVLDSALLVYDSALLDARRGNSKEEIVNKYEPKG